MTIGQLRDALATLPDTMPIKTLWDCTLFELHAVHVAKGHCILDCGQGREADWDAVKDELDHFRLGEP